MNIYNDVGNVAVFFQALQWYGDEIYRSLYFTPYDRRYFYQCCKYIESVGVPTFDDWSAATVVPWAVQWYVSLSQSFRHEEDDSSWLVAKEVNVARVYASHVDDFPRIIDLLRTQIQVENKDFADIFKTYDDKDTLFVCDPPYMPETWESDKGGYRNIMSETRHEELLDIAQEAKGQVIICGYPNKLYDERLKGWHRVTKTRKGGIKNSQQQAGDRTEVLWRKIHNEGLWGVAEAGTQADVSGVYSKEADFAAIAAFRKRNGL